MQGSKLKRDADFSFSCSRPNVMAQKTASGFCHSDVPPVMHSNYAVLVAISLFSSIIAAALIQLPYEQINGNLVPTVIFRGLPSTFHSFVVSVIVAFSGAFVALMIPNKPKISRFCGYYSMAAMLSAVGLLIWAISCGQSATSDDQQGYGHLKTMSQSFVLTIYRRLAGSCCAIAENFFSF
ncbi:hypothetical protein L1049_006200 [Liquidambar formosana]|uniref:Uncharacterized protein n=1 Tax=Liquidambar formosana TaxID=63359 RepID=A0AAP0RF21_LIQFO